MSLLKVDSLRVSFLTPNGLLKAVRGISFDLEENKTLALVGESGSGKSVTSKAILSLLGEEAIIEEGSILYRGYDLLSLSQKKMDEVRGKEIAMIFQDTSNTINPLLKVGGQFQATLSSKDAHQRKKDKAFCKKLRKLGAKKEEGEGGLLLCLEKDKASSLSRARQIEEGFKETMPLFEGETFRPSSIAKRLNFLLKLSYIPTLASEDLFDFIQSSLLSLLSKTRLLEARLKLKKKETRSEFATEISANPKEEFASLGKKAADFLSSLSALIAEKQSRPVDASCVLKRIKEIDNARPLSKKERKEEAISLLSRCGIEDPERVYSCYPFELSGGMRQRLSIALALCKKPKILIADEATTALDATVQEEILLLLEDLKKEYGYSLLFITHDLSVVCRLADEVAIMYGGKILEKGTVYDIFYDPRSPYTWGLLSSSCKMGEKSSYFYMKGNPPSPYLPLKGDPFAPRNPYALEEDFLSMPPFYSISSTHQVASYLYEDGAEEVTPPESVVDKIRESLKEDPSNLPSYANKKNSVLEILKKEGSLK